MICYMKISNVKISADETYATYGTRIPCYNTYCVSSGPLAVYGSLSQFPGGEVEISFDSDRSKANYQCVLLEDGSAPPPVIPCKKSYSNRVTNALHYILLYACTHRTGFNCMVKCLRSC